MVKYYTPQVEPLKNGKFKYSIRYIDPSFVGVHKSSTTITKNTAKARNLADVKVKKMIQDKLNIQSIKQITMDKLIEDLQTNMSNQGLAPKTLELSEKDRLILLLLLNLIHTLIIFFIKMNYLMLLHINIMWFLQNFLILQFNLGMQKRIQL